MMRKTYPSGLTQPKMNYLQSAYHFNSSDDVMNIPLFLVSVSSVYFRNNNNCTYKDYGILRVDGVCSTKVLPFSTRALYQHPSITVPDCEDLRLSGGVM